MTSSRDYLLDMLTYIEYLEAFSAEGRKVIDEDIKTQLAIQKAYEVIGEIAKRLPDELLDHQPQIRWKDLKGFRDVLIHQYGDIDVEIVWEAIEDLPNLRTAVEALIAILDQDTSGGSDFR